VLVISIIITIVAFVYIHRKINKAKPEVLHDRRRAKARKEWEMYGGTGSGAAGASSRFYPAAGSDSTERLAGGREEVSNSNYPGEAYDDGGGGPGTYSGVPVSVQPKRWDANGRAVSLLLDQPKHRDSAEVVQWEQPARKEQYDGRGQSSPSGYPQPVDSPFTRPRTQEQDQPYASRSGSESFAGYYEPYNQANPFQTPADASPARYDSPHPPSLQPGGGATPPPQQRKQQSLSASPPPMSPFSTAPPGLVLPPPLEPPPPGPGGAGAQFQPQQPVIPLNVPRYTLHDGPAPSRHD
jgi:hypothetical protein